MGENNELGEGVKKFIAMQIFTICTVGVFYLVWILWKKWKLKYNLTTPQALRVLLKYFVIFMIAMFIISLSIR